MLTPDEEKCVSEQVLLDALLLHLLQQEIYNTLLSVHCLLIQLHCDLIHHLQEHNPNQDDCSLS